MSKVTRATQALKQLGVSFTIHLYEYDPTAKSIGLQAANALGIPPVRLLKTLMTEVDGSPICVLVPSDSEVSMKKLASALKGKAARMMRTSEAERLTGYSIGGISPFGQKKRVPTVIDVAALRHETVFINGGQRGLQVEIRASDALRALDALAHPLTA
ncbi:Cys-tRNA(Pro) deacylase [Tardiphaga sp. 862_B3_N1_1]|uniref:Cys-tRNA(Pro) deacylase n=1 Tax=Tardiphaga sp. 862_B3_N1_1 TaxID=3240763 RepID=UPI003F88BC15